MRYILLVLMLFALNLNGKSLWFNKSEEYDKIYIPDVAKYLVNKPYSICIKYFPYNAGSHYSTLFSDGASAAYTGGTSITLLNSGDSTRMRIFRNNGNSFEDVTLCDTAHLKRKRYIGVTVSNGSLDVYSESIRTTYTGFLVDSCSTDDLYIGYWDGYGLHAYYGQIYEICLYNRKLSPDDIEYNKYHSIPMHDTTLILYYDFHHYSQNGDTIYDMSGNGYNGIIQGAKLRPDSWNTCGKASSKNLSFDGNNDYADLDTKLEPGDQDFSIVAFVDLKDTSKYSGIFSAGAPFTSYGYGIETYYDQGSHRYYIRGRDTTNNTFGVGINEGPGPIFYAGIKKADSTILYIDTIRASAYTGERVLSGFTTNWAVGKYGSLASTWSWDGNIYQLQYYIGKALTDSEVNYIRTHHRPIYCPELKVYYDFQHYSANGDTLYDMSGNHHNAVIYNANISPGGW